MLEVFSLILGTKCPFQCTGFDLDQSLNCKNGISYFWFIFMKYIIYPICLDYEDRVLCVV